MHFSYPETSFPVTFEITRQAVYLCRNNEEGSRKHCCRGKAISVTYCVYVCVSVALVIQRPKRMRVLSSVAF